MFKLLLICRPRERKKKRKLLARRILKGFLQREKEGEMIWNKLLFYQYLCDAILAGYDRELIVFD